MKVKLNLSKFRSDLEKQREYLVDRISADQKLHQSTINPDRSDLAWQYIQDQRNLVLSSRAKKRLAEIDSALERIENGSYGICERCGGSINPTRLEMIPTASICIKCKTSQM